jgi:hypothetical protein
MQDKSLVERAYLIVDYFAFEVVEHGDIGLKIIQVTDCQDERNKAIIIVQGSDFLEKASVFITKQRYGEFLDVMNTNAEFILEGYYGD